MVATAIDCSAIMTSCRSILEVGMAPMAQLLLPEDLKIQRREDWAESIRLTSSCVGVKGSRLGLGMELRLGVRA